MHIHQVASLWRRSIQHTLSHTLHILHGVQTRRPASPTRLPHFGPAVLLPFLPPPPYPYPPPSLFASLFRTSDSPLATLSRVTQFGRRPTFPSGRNKRAEQRERERGARRATSEILLRARGPFRKNSRPVSDSALDFPAARPSRKFRWECRVRPHIFSRPFKSAGLDFCRGGGWIPSSPVLSGHGRRRQRRLAETKFWNLRLRLGDMSGLVAKVWANWRNYYGNCFLSLWIGNLQSYAWAR